MSEASSGADAGFELVSRRLGALPLVNHLLTRAGVPALLARYLPAEDARYRLAPATVIGLVVLNLLAAGLTDDAMARHLGVSVRTVQRRVREICARLGARTRFQAGLQARRHGLL